MKRFLLFIAIITLLGTLSVSAQQQEPYVRIATIIVDSTQVAAYNSAVKEHAEDAVKKEPGVLTLYAVYDPAKKGHITVFEIYASRQAYELHIKTTHFLKYKDTVKDMVRSLTLTDVVPIALESRK